ncbi:MAG: hypothetical protein KME45_27405 [Stenomitos rutilans HA7619-LM2]|nr:hypothetical protein [Stenomitos rutilans HA7619-LM2]
MTDLERLQAQDAQIEEAESRRQEDIEAQIIALFVQLSPGNQAALLETLADEGFFDEDDEVDDRFVVAGTPEDAAQKEGIPTH